MTNFGTAGEPTMSYPAEHYSTPGVAADGRRGRLQQITRHSVYRATSNSASMCSCSSIARGSSCRAALLIGINAFSKPVHIVTNLSDSEEATSPVSNTSSSSFNERSRLLPHELIMVGNGVLRLPHYCVDVCTNARQLTLGRLLVEPANAVATTSSSSVVHEAAQCHASSQHHASTVNVPISEDAGGENGCINIATLRDVWRLTAASDDGDADSTDLGDPHFMIPIEESLIGQQSNLHELVIDY